MRYGLLVLLVLMTGCTAMKDGAKVSIVYGPGTMVRTIEDQGFWGPTIKTVYAYDCIRDTGVEPQLNVYEGNTYECQGNYVALQPQTANQSGVAASAIVPMVVAGEQAAGFAVGMDRLGKGVAKSGTKVNQSGGGAEADANSSTYSQSSSDTNIGIGKSGHRR